MPNRLIHESSPYLLQHAHNPVEWFAWTDEALQKAKNEDLPILVSIGYSACHWCHVMERESFENEQIADLMNQNFVCIKIDREERPDLDQIFMDSIQAMGLNGGWPLHVFLTPQGKPFYGGTYFPPQNWVYLIEQIQVAFKQNRQKLEDSAQKFVEVLNQSEAEKFGIKNQKGKFDNTNLELIFKNLARHFDRTLGGTTQAPKFPMPCIYEFLLRYYHQTHNPDALRHADLTLERMARGGIYDQIGGGFARYSTDALWFAPHFEKMLYDNAQLISLYAKAYMLTKNPFYEQIVHESIGFVERELLSPENGFYAALDADSEGKEGKFYVWNYQELSEILGEDLDLFCHYYGIKKEGNWEDGQNILYVKNLYVAQNQGISQTDLDKKIQDWKKILLEKRSHRPRPQLDDKILCSWNALMLKALTDAYNAFGEEKYLVLAKKNADFLLENLYQNGQLYRSYKHGKARFLAFLEDYALLIEALTLLYEACFAEKYLMFAEKLADYTILHFFDESENFFFYTDKNAEKLISRKKELFDNVIPASNSVMAHALWRLGKILDRTDLETLSQTMLAQMESLLLKESRYLANWAVLYVNFLTNTSEVVLTGKNYVEFGKQIRKNYLPNKVLVGSDAQKSELALLENRLGKPQSLIYVCQNKTCQLPVQEVEKALAML